MRIEWARGARRRACAALGTLVWFLASTGAHAQAPESSTAPEPATPQSRCAKPWCWKARSPDRGRAARRPPSANDPPPFSLSLGPGAAWFELPGPSFVRDLLPAEGSGDAAAKARGTSAGSEPHLFALPTVSLGITVQEPFLSLGELPLHLEQHFSFMAAEDFFPPEGSALAGFADFLVGVRATTLPLSASAGVALGASHLEFDGMDPIQGESVRFILAVMGLVRLELAEPFPGAVAVITRHGRLYESGTYRDLRLALELTL